MNAIYAMLYREAKIRLTNVTFIFWDLFYPLCYMLVFGVGINAAIGSPVGNAGVDYNAFFLGGVLAMASFGIAANTSWSFFLDRDNGIFFEMLTYPLSRAEYLLGKVVVNMTVAVMQAVIALALGWFIFGIRLRWPMLPLTLLGMALGTAGWFFFYAIFALKTRRNDVFNAVTSIFYFVFLFASAMFYPLDPLPRWLRTVAMVNPITWQIDWFRYTSIGLGDSHRVIVEGVAFVVFGLCCFAFAAHALQRQE